MAAIERIDRSRSRLASEVYERIVDALLRGTIAPGDRLIQDKLAEELDVSRTPVRDALLRLHEENIIVPSGRRGYVVRRLTSADVHQLYEARDAIEGHAAAVVAQRGGEALERVRRAFEQATRTKPTSTRDSFEANRAIHRAIVEATDNPHLLSFFDAIWGRALGGLAYHEFFVASPYDEFVDEHRELVEDLARGDAAHARAAMVTHIARGLARTPTGQADGDTGSAA